MRGSDLTPAMVWASCCSQRLTSCWRSVTCLCCASLHCLPGCPLRAARHTWRSRVDTGFALQSLEPPLPQRAFWQPPSCCPFDGVLRRRLANEPRSIPIFCSSVSPVVEVLGWFSGIFVVDVPDLLRRVMNLGENHFRPLARRRL